MKRSSKATLTLAAVIAGGMMYTAQPAEAKGILSRLGLNIDEISVTLKGKNSTSNSQQTPPPPSPSQEYRQPGPGRDDYYRREHERADRRNQEEHRRIEAQRRRDMPPHAPRGRY